MSIEKKAPVRRFKLKLTLKPQRPKIWGKYEVNLHDQVIEKYLSDNWTKKYLNNLTKGM